MKKVVALLVVVVSMVFLSGCSVKKTAELTDAEKFANEYSISVKNPFTYATIDEVLELLKHKSGVVFFGDSDCEWCITSASILSDIGMDQKVDTIYYYNPKKIKTKNTKEYQDLLSLLQDYLDKDERGDADLSLPEVYFVKNGKIIGHNNATTTIEKSMDTMTTKTKKKLREQYLDLWENYKKVECA